MSVYGAVKVELDALGASDTTEGQRALTLAGALDDRAGVQNLAATDKQLGAVMVDIRDRFTPKTESKLAFIRGGLTG